MSRPVPPFPASHHIDLKVDLDDADDDRRRMVAEWWCCDHSEGAWFRSVNKLTGVVRFSFDSHQDAVAFWLAN